MSLSIIIVNYKSASLVIDCLRSIFDQNSVLQFELIVVDNDSKDNSNEKIKELFPQVTYLEMNYNSGFARANNEAIRRSSGDTVLLLNADTIIENNAIEKCYEEFINSTFIACGVQLLNPDG
ncbi:MAG: glycosyltransferase, partial [Ginsengibacter sp.]